MVMFLLLPFAHFAKLRRPILIACVLLYFWWETFLRQLAKYVIVGGIATLLYWTIYGALLVLTTVWYIYASCAAVVIVFLLKFVVQKKWVFENAGRAHALVLAQAILLAGKYTIFSGMNTALLYSFVEFGGLGKMSGAIVATLCLGLFSFFASRWVFKT